MSMSKSVIGIVIVAILVLVGFLIYRGVAQQSTMPTQTLPSASPTSLSAGTPSATQAAATVTLTDQGFAPKSVTIKKGQTVTWVNESAQDMWVASNVHPIHSAYNGTTMQQHCPDAANSSFDACHGFSKGSTYSFTFDKTGTWGYHNHLDPSQTGTVVVE